MLLNVVTLALHLDLLVIRVTAYSIPPVFAEFEVAAFQAFKPHLSWLFDAVSVMFTTLVMCGVILGFRHLLPLIVIQPKCTNIV